MIVHPSNFFHTVMSIVQVQVVVRKFGVQGPGWCAPHPHLSYRRSIHVRSFLSTSVQTGGYLKHPEKREGVGGPPFPRGYQSELKIEDIAVVYSRMIVEVIGFSMDVILPDIWVVVVSLKGRVPRLVDDYSLCRGGFHG